MDLNVVAPILELCIGELVVLKDQKLPFGLKL